MKYLGDEMDNMHWNWKFWTWQQHQSLIYCSWTFYRLKNNPCCQLWTTTKVSSPNTTHVHYFCNANYTPPKSKSLYSFFSILWMIIIGVVWIWKSFKYYSRINNLLYAFIKYSSYNHFMNIMFHFVNSYKEWQVSRLDI